MTSRTNLKFLKHYCAYCWTPQNIARDDLSTIEIMWLRESHHFFFLVKKPSFYTYSLTPGVPNNFWNLLQSYIIPQITLQVFNFLVYTCKIYEQFEKVKVSDGRTDQGNNNLPELWLESAGINRCGDDFS